MDKSKNSKQPQRYHYDPELTRDFGVKASEKRWFRLPKSTDQSTNAVNSTPRVRGTAILGGLDRIGTDKGEEEAKIQHPHPLRSHLDAQTKLKFSKERMYLAESRSSPVPIEP